MVNDMPNMVAIRRMADEARDPEERILDAIEDKGDALEAAFTALWQQNLALDYDGVKAWHEAALTLANTAQAYAAAVKRLLDHASTKGDS